MTPPAAAASTTSPAWLGIDLGTSGVRALAVAADGRVVGRGDRRLASRRDGPRHEQSPEDWWEAAGRASRDALAEIPAGRVRGVAVCGTSGTILLVDPRDGAPLTPGLMYDDTRAAAQADRIGAPTSWALPKLLWVLDRRPELGTGPPAARLAHQPDFITRRLAGGPVPTDSSHALKTGYDLAAEQWPRRVTDALPPGLLPDVVRPGTTIGEVCPAAATHTGLPPGTPIVAGMTDGCAAQIAAGALRVGDWSSVLGTTLVLKGVTDSRLDDPVQGLYSHRAPDGEWLPGGASSAGAGALEAAFPGRDLDALTRAAAAAHAETRVLAYPLAGRGERFPFRAPEAEGFVVGEPAGEAERFAALLQGLAFVERLCFDVLDRHGAPTGGELTLSGGAAANRHLSQLRADVLGRPVRLVRHGESAFGMAVLAASPGRPLADVAAEMVEAGERFEPRPAETDRLVPRYARLLDELVGRGWLDSHVAAHARDRAGRG